MIIFRKQVLKQTVGEVEKKSEITIIPNKYKETFDNLIQYSNTESSDWPDSPDGPDFQHQPEPIDKRSCNAPRSRGCLSIFLKKDCLDEDVLVTSLESALMIRDFQMHQCHNVVLFGPKSRKTQHEKCLRDEKNWKSKRGRENRKGEKDRGGHWGN